MAEKQQMRLHIDVTDICKASRAVKICMSRLSLEVADGNILLNWIPKKPSEVSGTSQTICAEVQKIFKFWLQNYLKVYTHFFLNISFFFIFHRLRNWEITCQNWMTCLFLAWFFWTISIETLASYNGIGSSSWGLKWNSVSDISDGHAQVNRNILGLLL